MPIKVAIHHKTHYQYDRLISLSPHTIRLRPAPHSRTHIEAYTLRILPENHFINWQQDPFGNYLARVVFPEKVKELYVEVEVIASLAVINPFDFFVEEYAEDFPFKYDEQLLKELSPYLEIKEKGPLLTNWIKKIDLKKRRIVDFLVLLNQQLNQDINYSIRMEPGVQTCEETLGRALGSCRDSGWLLVQILRHFGLASRFVSGYLVQLTSDVKSLDGPSGPDQDFTDLHAWAEVYIPGAGWIGLDPTSGLFAAEGHIPLCCTPDPVSAAAITGLSDVCETTFSYSNEVTRIYEDPRVTKPYTETQWQDIVHLGYQVDKDLEENDVRLTMGGEPTFVSIDDMEADEWNTGADGVHKRELAGTLIKRLRNTFGKGGMLHYGMGKWYPGEPIPRWALTLFWRKDGHSIWHNEKLIADDTKDYGYTTADAKKFMEKLCYYLNTPVKNVSPVYEDAFYFIWKEGKVPVNIDPMKSDLKSPLERRTIAQVLNQGLDVPAGYVLPLEWNHWKQAWASCFWVFRSEYCFLIPGNSPIGLRLPLDSLPWIDPEKRPHQVERSSFEELPELDNFQKKVEDNGGGKPDAETINTIKTALSAEVRSGRLYLFIPPLSYLEHYLELLAAIEKTAEVLNMPVMIEGYEPPRDYRMEKIVVTPDPGVIEVNIHPSQTWEQLLHNSETLYEQARLSRLGTEKFMVDGRHTGTGGGNHITVGGFTPADSPLLRRPDLLRSLVTYWQHHPGLSYLFSSAFVGPTSQAPRVDEGRDEKLYELEIAFDYIPEPGKYIPFWLVDRLLRNLLVDLNGNTHRSEFCIDKLYSPDSSSGRLGILELRGFDMPPHYRMSMVQQLLIRTLISWFWKQPYKHKLIRWGTELHDRFMLEHYVRADLKDVTEDLKRAGYDFQLEWLDPFFEFRFPHHGTAVVENIQIELRMGIEPWHVLGEELSSSGTSRFVDSSVERIQVKVNGMTDKRHILVCNGRVIPLKPSGKHGEFVAGIRYKAWNPPSSLHPVVGVQSPLVFDLIDTWNGRSVGGCKYYVSHPGGRSYDTFPINAYEAESRRINRFWDFGYTPGAYSMDNYPDYLPSGPVLMTPPVSAKGNFELGGSQIPFKNIAPKEEENEEYPFTLDMRKPL